MARPLLARPRTRVEEILLARGVSQTEASRRTSWHYSTVHRIVVGRASLTPHSSATLARVLGCPVASLYEAIGAPIPVLRSNSNRRRQPVVGFSERLEALLAILGIPDLEAVLRYLLEGDYSQMRPEVARRIKAILDNQRG